MAYFLFFRCLFIILNISRVPSDIVVYLGNPWPIFYFFVVCLSFQIFLVFHQIQQYSQETHRGRGVYCFTSVRRSKIVFVSFFSATINGRNLIFGPKLHIGMPYCGQRFWTRQIPTSCLPKSGGIIREHQLTVHLVFHQIQQYSQETHGLFSIFSLSVYHLKYFLCSVRYIVYSGIVSCKKKNFTPFKFCLISII